MKALMWKELTDLCQYAKHEVILAAPYIKANLLSELLQKIPDHVDIQCVTRWQAADIALGVNDLEAYDLVRSVGGGFSHHSTLHAKYYRADENCLIGSANLTSKALGKSPQPNLELLKSFPFKELRDFEAQMLADSVRVDDEFRKSMADMVADWKKDNPDTKPILSEENADAFPLACWLPEAGMLYPFYRETNHQTFSPAWIEAARHDLNVLQIPPNLSEKNFKESIAKSLQSFLVVNQIKALSKKQGITEEDGKELLENVFVSPLPEEAWNILCKWLIEYLNYTLIDGTLYQKFG